LDVNEKSNKSLHGPIAFFLSFLSAIVVRKRWFTALLHELGF
jgi:hypothetical protein